MFDQVEDGFPGPFAIEDGDGGGLVGQESSPVYEGVCGAMANGPHFIGGCEEAEQQLAGDWPMGRRKPISSIQMRAKAGP